ncbi:MAG: ABC transporter substrate-binding protein [Pseudomonadota bacterium]
MMRFGAKRTIRAAALAGFLLAPMAGMTAAEANDTAPVRVGQSFLAGGLDAANGSTGWALVSHGIAEQLFTVSRDGRVVPQLAAGATLNEDGSWTIVLEEGRRFSDGSPVSAEAVAESLNRTVAQNPIASASAGEIAFEPTGERTLMARTERPTPILPSILAEWAFPIYRAVGEGFVFTGPFAVEAMVQGSHIDLVPNPHHPNAEHLPAVTLQRLADGQTMALALRAGELDLAFNLPVETLGLVGADPDLAAKTFPVAYQYMMFMNTAHPALADEAVRKAIDLAINREALVQGARAGSVATGAFADIYPFALADPITADPDRAAQLLDDAGWVKGDDGVRRKDGEPLRLQLLAYPQRPDLITFQPIVRAMLGELGIEVTTQVTEEPTATVASGAFDLALWAQHTAPAGDPLMFLALFFETDAPRNYVGWSNETFDEIIASLRTEADTDERIALAHKAQQILMEEAPVSFLVTPEWHVGMSSRLAGYEPWGSDYYVLRSDLTVAD